MTEGQITVTVLLLLILIGAVLWWKLLDALFKRKPNPDKYEEYLHMRHPPTPLILPRPRRMMVLLTVNEWLGPGRRMSPSEKENRSVTERSVCFASRQSLSEAITHLHAYEEAYNAVYPLAVNFTVLTATLVANLDDDVLEKARIENLDQLPSTPAALQTRRERN